VGANVIHATLAPASAASPKPNPQTAPSDGQQQRPTPERLFEALLFFAIWYLCSRALPLLKKITENKFAGTASFAGLRMPPQKAGVEQEEVGRINFANAPIQQ